MECGTQRLVQWSVAELGLYTLKAFGLGRRGRFKENAVRFAGGKAWPFNDVAGTQQYRASNRIGNVDTDVYSTWDARRAVLSVNYSFGKSIELMQRKAEAERSSM